MSPLPANHGIGDTGHTTDHNTIESTLNTHTTQIAAKLDSSTASATYAALQPTGHAQQINNGTFTLTTLSDAFGYNFKLAVLDSANPPQPPDSALGGYGAALASSLRVSGSPTNTVNGSLFVDAQLTRLDIYGYNDAAVATYASATAHEIDVALSQSSNNVRVLNGLYTVLIAGSSGAVTGTVAQWRGIWSDTLQGSAAAGGLTITSAVGIYASRPYRTGANITIGSQYSLIAEEGQYFLTDSTDVTTAFTLANKTNGKRKSMRVDTSGALQVANDAFTAVILQLTDTGHLLSQGTAPTVVANAAAGTGATATVAGTDVCGIIHLTTGTGASAGLLCTLTFANSWASSPNAVVSKAALAAGLTDLYGSTNTTQLQIGGTPNSSTSYWIAYMNIGN